MSAESCCYNMRHFRKNTLNLWPDTLLSWQKTHLTCNDFTKKSGRMKGLSGKNACLEANMVRNSRNVHTYCLKYFLKRMFKILKTLCNTPVKVSFQKLMHLLFHSVNTQILGKHSLKKGIKINLFKENQKTKLYSVSNPANPKPFKTLQYF